MSLLKHLEDEAGHLLDAVNHIMAVQMNSHGMVTETTQKIHDALDAHVNATALVQEPVQHVEDPDHIIAPIFEMPPTPGSK